MTPVTVTLQKIGSTDSISITVNIKESSVQVEFSNLAAGRAGQQRLADLGNPYLTDANLEVACCTGARFVRWLVGKSGLSVEVLSFECRGDIQNVEPFAMAVAIAAFRTFDRRPEPTFPGWVAV
jgi:hypothetical protein